VAQTINYKEWQIAHEEDPYRGTVKFIIYRINQDGSRDVLKDGKKFHVEGDRFVDEVCGPTIEVPLYELHERKVI